MEFRKKWEKPKLSVVLRNQPEEAVLAAYKATAFGNNLRGFVAGCRRYLCAGSCSVTSNS